MKARIAMCAVLLLGLSGCASTEYKSYVGKNTNVIEGRGGTRVVVDGMEIWDNGSPPRKFTILGIIDDSRPDALVPMAQMRGDIVQKARLAGGDAVVLMNNQSEITGYSNFGGSQVAGNRRGASAFAAAFSTANKVNHSRFAVIKYAD